MSALSVFEMTTAENKIVAIDFTNAIPSGETLSSAVVSAKDDSDGNDENSILASTTATISGSIAKCRIRSLTANKKYRIVFLATTSGGSIIEERLTLNSKASQA